MQWLEDLEYSGLARRKLEFILACLALTGLGMVNPILAVLGPVMLVGLPMFLAESKRIKVKKELPEVALEISTLWGILPLDKILMKVKNEELNKIGRMMVSGVPPLRALKASSTDVNPITRLLISAYSTGGDISIAMRHLAEDLAKEESLKSEMKSMLSIEKLTMMGGAVLVPFILGITSSLAKSINISAITNSSSDLASFASTGNYVYIIEYAIIGGVYLGIVDGGLKKSLVYSALLATIAFFVFQISLGFTP